MRFNWDEEEFEPIRPRTAGENPPDVDTSDVHVSGGPDLDAPAWVIRSGEGVRDSVVGVIKSGKEGDVTLVRRTKDRRQCLLAVKTFRPRARRAFKREDRYRGARSLGDARIDRAVGNRSRFGRAILEFAWAAQEYPMQRRAWRSGARVPFPVEPRPDGLAMQYLGDRDGPAPRLVDTDLTTDEWRRCYELVVRSMRRMAGASLVHADLSAYNILWWNEEPWFIDFPQTLDLADDYRLTFLRRDVANICTFFGRRGVDCDTHRLLVEVMEASPVGWNEAALW